MHDMRNLRRAYRLGGVFGDEEVILPKALDELVEPAHLAPREPAGTNVYTFVGLLSGGGAGGHEHHLLYADGIAHGRVGRATGRLLGEQPPRLVEAPADDAGGPSGDVLVKHGPGGPQINERDLVAESARPDRTALRRTH